MAAGAMDDRSRLNEEALASLREATELLCRARERLNRGEHEEAEKLLELAKRKRALWWELMRQADQPGQ